MTRPKASELRKSLNSRRAKASIRLPKSGTTFVGRTMTVPEIWKDDAMALKTQQQVAQQRQEQLQQQQALLNDPEHAKRNAQEGAEPVTISRRPAVINVRPGDD